MNQSSLFDPEFGVMDAVADAVDFDRAVLSHTAPSVPAAVHFDGETYDPKQDRSRLFKQLQRVFDAMKDGEWHNLIQLYERLDQSASEASISARIRDLRKERFGGHTVERRRVTGGYFEYRLVIKSADVSR